MGFPYHRKILSESLADLRHRDYGVVSYFHVLEHVLDPPAELLMARGLIAPKGLLVVEVPFFDSLPWRLLGSRHRHFYRGHRSYFNKRSLSALLAKAGFTVMTCEAVPYFMTMDWLLMRLGSGTGILRRGVGRSLRGRCLKINTGEYLMAVARKRD